MPLYIAQSGDLDRCYRCLTDSQRKDRATQLLIKYKSGALVTQLSSINEKNHVEKKDNYSKILELLCHNPLAVNAFHQNLWPT